MNNLYTIGFTQKTAETFFKLLIENDVKTVLDIRLNNTSQLAGFSKYPDIEFFLSNLCEIEYIHDDYFSPEENTLKRYKSKEITWDRYVNEFNNTMNLRKIGEYILNKYADKDNLCLLCSEPTAKNCHRRLVADYFKEQFTDVEIKHL